MGNEDDLSIWLRADHGTYGVSGEEVGYGEAVHEWRDVLSGNFSSAYQDDGEAAPLATEMDSMDTRVEV